MKRKHQSDHNQRATPAAVHHSALQSLTAGDPYHFTDDDARLSPVRQGRAEEHSPPTNSAGECSGPSLNECYRKAKHKRADVSCTTESVRQCTAVAGHQQEGEATSRSLAGDRRHKKHKRTSRQSLAAEAEKPYTVAAIGHGSTAAVRCGSRLIATESDSAVPGEGSDCAGATMDDAACTSDGSFDRPSPNDSAGRKQVAARPQLQAEHTQKMESKRRSKNGVGRGNDDDEYLKPSPVGAAVPGADLGECSHVSATLPSPEPDIWAAQNGECADEEEMTREDMLIDSILNVHLTYKGVTKKNSPYDRDTAIQLLARHGIVLATGRWSQQEMRRLCQNFEGYCRRHPEVDIRSLLSGTRHLPPKQRKKLRQQAAKTQLYSYLARGIRRSKYLVYFKAMRMFHGARMGAYSTEERQQLLRLVEQHGRNWLIIGDILDRNRMSCHDTYGRLIRRKRPHTKGEFTSDEDELLLQAVNECIDRYGLSEPYEGLPWNEVAAAVHSRTAAQCSYRWVHHLCYTYSHAEHRRPFGIEDKLLLLELVCSTSVMEECHLDWHELMEHFDNVGSPQQLRQLWFKHLKTKVPSYQLLTFEQICDYLYTDYEPLLRSQVKADLPQRHLGSGSPAATTAH